MIQQSVKPLKNPLVSAAVPLLLRAELEKAKDFWSRRLEQPKEILAHSLCAVSN